MTYKEFKRQLGKAGISSVREFADILNMNPNSITNYSTSGEVPSHLAIIAALLGEMAENQIDFKKVFRKIKFDPKKPRGKAAKGIFGGTHWND